MANVKLRSSGRSYKVGCPKRGLPPGLRQNAAPASPPSSVVGPTTTFVVRLAIIRILQSSAIARGSFRVPHEWERISGIERLAASAAATVRNDPNTMILSALDAASRAARNAEAT